MIYKEELISKILDILAKSPKPLTRKEIAKKLGLDLYYVLVVWDQLVKRLCGAETVEKRYFVRED